MGFPGDGNTSSTIEFLFTCYKINNSIPIGRLDPTGPQHIGDRADDQYSWNQRVDNASECEKSFEEFVEFMSENAEPEHFANKLTEIIYPQYEININKLIEIEETDFRSKFPLNRCSTNKEQMITLDNLYFDTLQLGKNISESSSYEETINYAKEMLFLYKEKQQYAGNEKSLYDEFYTPCHQLVIGAGVYEKAVADINVDFENIVDQRNFALAQFYSAVNHLNHVKLILHDINKTMEECDRYFDPMENMTKQDLFRAFDEPKFTSNFKDFQYFTKCLKVTIDNYIFHMNRIKEDIVNIFENVLALELPTLHGSNVHNLRITSDTYFVMRGDESSHIVEGLSANMQSSMTSMWNITINRLIDPFKNMDIFEDIDLISSKLEAFVKELGEYNKSLEVSTDFLR